MLFFIIVPSNIFYFFPCELINQINFVSKLNLFLQLYHRYYHYQLYNYPINNNSSPRSTYQMSSQPVEQITNKIHQCLSQLSIKPRYQYFLIGLMCLIWIQITYSAMIGSYIFMNPLFQCNSQSATEVDACISIQKCIVTNAFTATSYNKLYCDRKWIRTTLQSIYALGALIGMFGLPALSDAKGRKFSILTAFYLQIIGISLMVLGIYEDIPFLMILGQFLTGIYASGMVILSYVITGEFCSDSIRQTAIMVYCSMWGLGQISYFFLYNYMPEWDYYLILLCLIPSIGLTIICAILLIQSPQYCLILQRNEESFRKSIQKLALFNKSSQQALLYGQHIGTQIIQNMSCNTSKSSATFVQTMRKFTKNKNAMTACLCLALSQLAYNTFYYGVQGSLERTGYNFGLSMLLIGVHEFIAYLTASYFIKKIKRKTGLIVAIFITSLIGLTFLLDFVKDNQIVQSIVISVTRVSCVYCYSLLSIMETQSFPSQIKSTAIGLTVGLSQIGRIAVPYLITEMNDIGIHPVIAASCCFLALGILPLIPVKETFKRQEINGSNTQKKNETLLQSANQQN